MSTPQPWFVLRFNHFDPTWRRCWDRDFVEAGRRFVSYRTIEERWISDAIATCADGASCFLVECAWVLRHYLERHPEQRETMRALAQQGRFELLGSGENIVDANMLHGELLVRNLTLGTWWGEATLGMRPTTGWHSDGFGSCAQMPQLFRQCGYDWLPAISYNTPDAPFWRGLDGSTIFFSPDASTAPFGGTERLVHRQGVAGISYRKLAPCPACQGEGCPDCEGGGFVIGARAELAAPPAERLPGTVGVIMLWGEELLPGVHVADAVAELNATRADVVVRQGVYRDLRPFLADYLAQVDAPPAELISSTVENNPSQSGCYVSRIAIKQGHRRLEHALLAAECWDALLAGGAAHNALQAAWRDMTFSAFHDAITSSHCDPAYDELRDLHRDLTCRIGQVATAACARVLTPAPTAVTVFNHTGAPATCPVRVQMPGAWSGARVTVDAQPVPVYALETAADATVITFLAPDVPGLGARTFTLADAPLPIQALPERTVSCGPVTVEAGEHGLTGITVDGIGPVVTTDTLRVGELILETDIGDPWATRSLDRSREPLGPYTTLRGIERRGDGVVIRYTGRHRSSDDPHYGPDPAVTLLTWEQAFHLRAGVPWLEVETQVVWYTHSRRLRLAFPSTHPTDRGVYEVPYGTLARERYEGTRVHGGNAGGDWPAIHWAGVQAPDHTFAVFNQGTPSYRVEDGVVLVSLLRSPQLPYGLFEPESYTAYNFHGMADHGTHTFHHALYVGPGQWPENETTRLSALFNSGLTACSGRLTAPLPSWRITAGHTHLTAVKPAEDGQGLVLRLVESAGQPEIVQLTPPPAFTQATRCNVLEDAGEELAATGGTFSFAIKPWEIMSVRVHGRRT
jgi:alpha-mannosidase